MHVIIAGSLSDRFQWACRYHTILRIHDYSTYACMAQGFLIHIGFFKSYQRVVTCVHSRDQFDSPSITTLGANKVIPGLEEGLSGMCVGEKREVVVPPHWGHGENGGQS